MMRAFYEPGFAAPLGQHIMPIRKFALVAEEVGAWPWVQLEAPAPLTPTDLQCVHTAEYVEAVYTGEPRALAESQKFPWSAELFPSVCLTGGGVLAAARAALADGVAATIASGFHHACADHGEGFCTFNSLVVALELLRTEGRLERAAVLDLDLHYGNGTAQLAASRPWLSALSIYGNDYWDNRAYRDVSTRHHEDGVNHRSLALPAGSGREVLLRTLADGLEWLEARAPELVLYQAGADPYHEDPYSPLALDHADLLARDEAVFRWARVRGIPIAWVLAGGYTEDVRKVVLVHTNTFRACQTVYGFKTASQPG